MSCWTFVGITIQKYVLCPYLVVFHTSIPPGNPYQQTVVEGYYVSGLKWDAAEMQNGRSNWYPVTMSAVTARLEQSNHAKRRDNVYRQLGTAAHSIHLGLCRISGQAPKTRVLLKESSSQTL